MTDEAPRVEAVAEVPLGDLPLYLARDAVEDASWWWQTMPAILMHYPAQVSSVEAYWRLLVAEHAVMVTHLQRLGLWKERDGHS